MTNVQSVPTTASRVTDFHRRQFHNYRSDMDLLLHKKGFRAPNVALLGFKGDGKSTFLNTCGKILVDEQNLVSIDPCGTTADQRMNFKDIQEDPPSQKVLLRILDTYSVNIGRYDQETIDKMKEGRGRYLELTKRPNGVAAEAVPQDRIHTFILIVSCTNTNAALPEKMRSLIRSLGNGTETNGKTIPNNFIVVLTKVDMKVPQKFAKEWDSPDCQEIQELKSEWANKLGVQENRVYAMSNFFRRPDEETRIYTAGKVYNLLYDTLQICKEELQKLPDAGSDSVNDSSTI